MKGVEHFPCAFFGEIQNCPFMSFAHSKNSSFLLKILFINLRARERENERRGGGGRGAGDGIVKQTPH